MTSSSTRPAKRRPVSWGATGAASTTRRAPWARATWQAAFAVEPVATPSSTISAVRPSRSSRGTRARKSVARRRSSTRSAASTRSISSSVTWADAAHLLVEHADAVLADGAHGELPLEREPELADEDHVERGVQRGRDLEGDGNAAAGETEHDEVHVRGSARGPAPVGSLLRCGSGTAWLLPTPGPPTGSPSNGSSVRPRDGERAGANVTSSPSGRTNLRSLVGDGLRIRWFR